MNEVDVFKKNFPVVEIETLRRDAWRIHTLTGFVEYKDGVFTRTVGGPDVYRGTMLCAKDFGWPFMVLKASKNHNNDKHIVACMAHGREVGMDVVVEVDSEDEDILFCLMCFAIWLLGWWLAQSLLNQNLWGAIVISAISTKAVVSKWIEPRWDRWAVRNARQRGQVYTNSLPDVHGDFQRPIDSREIATEHYEP